MTHHSPQLERPNRQSLLLSVAFGFITLAAVTLSDAAAADWPQFLGPQRNGISAETGLISEWPADGLKEVWRQDLGVGMSGVAVQGDMLLTLFQDETHQYLVARSAESGNELWKTPIAPVYRNSMGDGPRATPTIADGQAYAFSGQGILVAVDLKTGQTQWTVNTVQELHGEPAEYGMASSPLVVGSQIVVQTGADAASVAAFERRTGRITWKAGSGAAGYSSPMYGQFGGTDQIITFTGAGAFGLNPKDGQALWSFPFKTAYDCNTATPVLMDEGRRLLLSAGENHGSSVLSLKTPGNPASVAADWESHGPRSLLRAEWQTPIVVGNHIFGLDNVGSAGQVTHLTCLKLPELEQVWQKSRFGKSNGIYADGKLFFTTMQGDVVIVRANPERFEELGRQPVLGKTRQAPALANGLIYVRDDVELVCLSVR